MQGNNELILCEAEMIKALQLYVDHLMRESEVKVTSVKQDDNSFIIKLSKEE